MPRISLRAFCACAVLAAGAISTSSAVGWAQTAAARHVQTPDSIYAHAKWLVVNGNGAAGRLLVDSMVAATQPGTPAYADALYWRASLSPSITDAERDLRTIIVEYPLAPRAADALLQLGQLEAASGDRAAAAGHLEQYLIENPTSPEQGRAGLLLVQTAFEQNDLRRGCSALGRALRAVPADQVELRNQLQYYSPRCVGVDTTNAPAPKLAASGHAAKARTARGNDSAQSTRAAKGEFTLQVAAFSSRADAEALAAKLKKRGLDTRVVGTKKPFRVHVGYYATHAEAAAAAKKLEAKKINAFVTAVKDGT